MKKDFHKIVINLNQNEINDLLDYFNEARKETLKKVEKMMDLYSYCAVCGNKLINGECISHIEAISLINYDELKQEINKLKEDLKK